MSSTSLPSLANITRVGRGILRILGQNPGPFTLQGTNTYLVGEDERALILIDTGEGRAEYLPLLECALSTYYPTRGHIHSIILTHSHSDHIGGLPTVLTALRQAHAALPRIYKFSSGRDAREDEALNMILSDHAHLYHLPSPSSPGDSSLPTLLYHRLAHDQVFPISPSLALTVLHTPGHTPDSISLLYASTSTTAPAPPAPPPLLFTADTVLGHSTPVFQHLGHYLASLHLYLDRLAPLTLTLPPLPSTADSTTPSPLDTKDISTLPTELSTEARSQKERETQTGMGTKTDSERNERRESRIMVHLLCGHGEVVHDGVSKIEEYIQHRLNRERQVFDALKDAEVPPSAAE